MVKINLHPTVCNLCGGKVIFTSNGILYGGREFGSGKCYYCTSCHASVGTHEPEPDKAKGILADAEMQELRKKCHALFDEQWLHQDNKRKARTKAYRKLSKKLGISETVCHFGFFDKDTLNKAISILEQMNKTISIQ